MSVVVIEIVGSREANVSIDAPSIELMFTATGSYDDAEIRAAIEAELPATRNITSAFFGTMTLTLQSYRVRQRQEGGPNFDGTAMYGRTQPRKTGQLWFSFDGTGGTAHIQTSLGTSSYAAPDIDEIPDFSNAIGVSADTVEGCDKVVPIFKFRLDYYPATALMTPDYILKLYNLQAKPVNNNDVNIGGITFAPKTILFLGPTGQPRGFDDWELGFHFIASPNLTGLQIGDIEGIFKKGHEYLWVRFKDAVSNTFGVKVPEFVFVEEIYEAGDFGDLGIDGIPIQGLAVP